jgi:hypothetical protein
MEPGDRRICSDAGAGAFSELLTLIRMMRDSDCGIFRMIPDISGG